MVHGITLVVNSRQMQIETSWLSWQLLEAAQLVKTALKSAIQSVQYSFWQ